MKCPEVESLSSYALSPEGCDDIENHILECAECRNKLEIIHETILADSWTNPSKTSKSDKKTESIDDKVNVNAHENTINKFLHTATRDMRDRFGVISIPAGGEYLQDPVTGECELATVPVKAKFEKRGFSLYVNPAIELSRMCCGADSFGVAHESNIKDMKGLPIPGINIPWKIRIKPWPIEMRFTDYKEITYVNNGFVKHLVNKGLLPLETDVNLTIWQSIKKLNFLKIYELSGDGIIFRIYSIFVTPFKTGIVNGVDKLIAQPVDVNVRTVINELIDVCESEFVRPNCLLLSMGAFDGNLGADQIQQAYNRVEVFSSGSVDATGNVSWNVRHHSLNHMRPIYKRLIYRLYPESIATWRDRVVTVLNEPYAGTMTVNKVSKLSVVPDCAVADIFDELRRTKKWKSVKSGIGEMGIAPRQTYDKDDAGPFIAKNRIALFMGSIQLLIWPIGLFILGKYCHKLAYGDVQISPESKLFASMSTGIWAIYQFCRVYKNYKQKINE